MKIQRIAYLMVFLLSISCILPGCAGQDTVVLFPQCQEIIAKADARREVILNSPTEITVEGTSYFVSADGDDSNSGKSEDAPWATLDKVNSAAYDRYFWMEDISDFPELKWAKENPSKRAKLNAGDVVLFENDLPDHYEM